MPETIEGDLSEQVRQDFHSDVTTVFSIDDVALQDVDIQAVTQSLEILKGTQMDVGGVVPLVGEGSGSGHPSTKRQLYATAPVAEIGEGDDSLAANA